MTISIATTRRTCAACGARRAPHGACIICARRAHDSRLQAAFETAIRRAARAEGDPDFTGRDAPCEDDWEATAFYLTACPDEGRNGHEGHRAFRAR